MKVLKNALIIFVIFTLLCGVIYTAAVTGIAQLFFPNQANGSIIEVNGVKYLNYNTKPLFFNGKNSFLPKEEKTAARKRKTAQGLTPCAAETH